MKTKYMYDNLTHLHDQVERRAQEARKDGQQGVERLIICRQGVSVALTGKSAWRFRTDALHV